MIFTSEKEIIEFTLGMIICVLIIIISLLPIIKYKRSEYCKETGYSYASIKHNKGIRGEYLIWQMLENLGGYKKFIFNCYIPRDNDKTTEIDIILIHESGIYVFESKNYSGWIFGHEKQNYWTQTLPTGQGESQKEKFLNPIIQNQIHINCLKEYLNQEESLFYSYIIFGDRCVLRKVTITNTKYHVIIRRNIFNELNINNQLEKKLLSQEEINNIYDKLKSCTNVSEETKSKHRKEIELSKRKI